MTILTVPDDRPDLDRIVSEEYRIDSRAPGVSLHLRNKRLQGVPTGVAERTVVMVHGATYSSGSLYDVPLGGFSFMDYLAARGFDVFAVDVRGYGRSTRPPPLEVAPSLNPPSIGTDVGVEDFTAAVDFVLKLRGLGQANLFAMSWGGTVAGAYAAANLSKVSRLALLAPQWLSAEPIPLDPGGELGAYRLVPVGETRPRWLGAAPPEARDRVIPTGWFEQWAEATLAEDPWSAAITPGRLRAVNGPIQDIRDFWRADRPYWSPSDVTVPVLLLHGEWDKDVPVELALAIFREFRNAPWRRWVELGEATHMALLEKNRLQAFRAIAGFFEERYAPE